MKRVKLTPMVQSCPVEAPAGPFHHSKSGPALLEEPVSLTVEEPVADWPPVQSEESSDETAEHKEVSSDE